MFVDSSLDHLLFRINRIFAIYNQQTLRLLNNKARPIIYVNNYNLSVVSDILEGIAAKFIIGVVIAFI